MKKWILFFSTFITFYVARAQAPQQLDGAQIYEKLQKLSTLGSVLYIAAHPDDENTQMIAWLSNQKHYETAYMALTRGDGGQNLIGPEIRAALGVIRTQELLAARRIDGGQQFFSRANDFGYSKNPTETFQIWDKKEVLSDLVRVIRKFRPDVIITRFNVAPGTTHGHHTASAMLAKEAYREAGKERAFKNQLDYVQPWQPKKLFWNTSWWFAGSRDKFDTTGLMAVNVGGYNPILGISYNEMAAHSRSQHKSQGFGVLSSRGNDEEYLKQWEGPKGDSLFSGIPTNWTRIGKAGMALQKKIDDIIAHYDFQHPEASVTDLVDFYNLLQKQDQNNYWVAKKEAETKALIPQLMGLYTVATTDDYLVTRNEKVPVKIEITNRSAIPVSLEGVHFSTGNGSSTVHQTLANNEPFMLDKTIQIPSDAPYSQPYWLKDKWSKGMYTVKDQQERGQPENGPAISAQIKLNISGTNLEYTLPLLSKQRDRVKGEVFRPVYIIPGASLDITEETVIFPDLLPQSIKVKVHAHQENVRGKVHLELPEGWTAKENEKPVYLPAKGDEATVSFKVTPPQVQSTGDIKAVLVDQEGNRYDQTLQEIAYDHIPYQILLPDATVKVSHIALKTKGQNIGYIPGAGDQIPEALRAMGYTVQSIDLAKVSVADLQQYDAIVIGVRAYNTNEDLAQYNDKLLDYVKLGGTAVVQYNTSYGLLKEDFAPYPIQLSHDRVTVEEAKVDFLNKKAALLNLPNKISDKDFDGWVQERGLYFPDKWDSHYKTLISCHDPGESAKESSILYAQYGKGLYIYTGLSFFRELPAGVPGAYRLFANLVSARP